MIDQIAQQQGVEPVLVHAVISAESAYDPSAVSHAGAIGLMQLMPATAADYGVSDLSLLFDPETNVVAGTRHLKRLLAKYDNDYGRAIMAYNAGEGVVDRTNSQVTFTETLDYTEAVLRRYGRPGGQRPTNSALQQIAALRARTDRRAAHESLQRYLDAAILPKTGRALESRLLGPTARESLAAQDVVTALEPWRKTRHSADPAIDPAVRDRGRLPRYE
jgi:hypothetical protein